MKGFRHISSRLIVWTLGGAAVALFALGYYQQWQTRRMVLAQAEARAAAVTASIKEELQGVLHVVETSVHLTVARVEQRPPTAAEIDRMLQDLLAANRLIYGGTVAFEPFATPAGQERFAPYLFQQAGGLGRADLASPEYAYWNQPWYREPLSRGTPVWTEPYFDEGAGNVLMVTYAQPFFRPGPDGPRVAGVATADVALSWLKRVVESNRPGANGFVIIFSGSGRIIAHPRTQLIQRETLESLAVQTQQPKLIFIQSEVAAGRSGNLSYDSKIFQARVRLDFRPVRVGGWGVIVGYEEQEFLAPVAAAGRVAFGSALVALALLAGLIVLVSRRITLPLGELAATADQMATGNLDVAIAAPRTRDELGHLTTSFIRMRDDLRRYIADLATATAAKQKLESELAIAQQIQRTMLPAPRHTARGRHSATLTTQIVPAKAVGGDLYTYFATGSRLFFAAGDVSDKGVPAALFMARTITLLRTIARDTASPDEILCRVNAELCPDNDECMFVTLFCGVLDLDTGELVGASAGHEQPVIINPAGAPRLWEMPAGPALGLNSDITVPLARLTLTPGDTLLLYTDGVTDTVNPSGELFQTAGLLQASARIDPAAPDPTADLLRQLQTFAAGAPQPDDITLFALRFD